MTLVRHKLQEVTCERPENAAFDPVPLFSFLCVSTPVTKVVGMVPISSTDIPSVTVTSTNDSGPGSLRQAIADAEPGATIQFDLTYPATITLTSGELWISTKDVTIAGPGPDLLAISGNHSSRVFRAEAHPPYDIHVSISGLTIRNAYATAVYCSEGGGGAGLYVGEGILSVTLTDVVFRENSTKCSGGGMFHMANGHDVALTNVSFYDNSAGNDGGGLWTEDSATLTNVSFYGNSATSGGGLWAEFSDMNLTRVLFCGNLARQNGGGVRSYAGEPTLTNVTFGGNSARQYGGGIYISGNLLPSTPRIQNSILWGNRAGAGGDQVCNSLYNDVPPTIAYSDIEGSGGSGAGWDSSVGFDGGGNLDADPRFMEPVDPDSAPTTTCDLHPQWGSPAIDDGNNSLVSPEVATDLDGAPRISNGIVDLGAYESQEALYLSKFVSDAWVRPGQHITYTITVLNGTGMTMTSGLISDTLPTGLAPAGPVFLDPPGAGVISTAPPIHVSDLTINP
jgi:uncharacterized repeat protein (TIGR01451 family)